MSSEALSFRSPFRDQRGFTLLEIIVAFTLMALIIAVLLRVFSGGLQGIGLAEDYARATSIGESALARVGADIDLKEGSTAGEVDERYKWSVELRPYDPPLDVQPGTTATPITLPVVMWEIMVRVVWTDAGKERAVSFRSLRVGPRT